MSSMQTSSKLATLTGQANADKIVVLLEMSDYSTTGDSLEMAL